MGTDIRRFVATDRDPVVELSLRAWAEVFEQLRPAVPAFVYDSFYPDGWDVRQRADVEAVIDGDEDEVWVAADGGQLLGWVAVRRHPADSMGEIYVLAVDPGAQRRGVGSALVEHAVRVCAADGLRMVMVETGGDPGHAPARETYERAGFTRWPVARYFRPTDVADA